MARLILGGAVGDMPSRYLTDVTEFLYLPEISDHVSSCTKWSSARIEEYDIPQFFPPEFRRSCAFGQRFIYRLSDVIAAPRSGAVLMPGSGRLVGESCGALLRAVGWGDVRPDLLARSHRPPWENPVVLSPPTGYYHWLLEILPRILAARDTEPGVSVLVPAGCPEYVTEALPLLGFEVIETSHRALRLKDVLVPAALQAAGFIPTTDVDQIRRAVLPIVSGPSTEPPRSSMIYISRAKDSCRRLGNERAVEDLMCELDFEVLYLQDMSWVEQVHRMSMAKVVVAPHGAGLANLIWSTGLRNVIEIFPSRLRNDCYAHLAVQQGVNYSFLVAENDPSSSGEVDLRKLRTLASAVRDLPGGR